MLVQSLGQEDPLEKGMATQSSIFAWRIPWTGAWQTTVHRMAKSRTWLSTKHSIPKEPTPVFLPGESQGRGSLVGCCLWGCTESDTTEVTQQQQQQPFAVVSDSLQPHGLQHARLPCPSPFFLELAQTHVHWVSDAIQPFHPLLSPSPPALNLSQHQYLFQWVGSLHEVTKVLACYINIPIYFLFLTSQIQWVSWRWKVYEC